MRNRNNTICAVLTENIEFPRMNGTSAVFPKGYEVVVDVKDNICLANGEYFDITEGEYRSVYLN